AWSTIRLLAHEGFKLRGAALRNCGGGPGLEGCATLVRETVPSRFESIDVSFGAIPFRWNAGLALDAGFLTRCVNTSLTGGSIDPLDALLILLSNVVNRGTVLLRDLLDFSLIREVGLQGEGFDHRLQASSLNATLFWLRLEAVFYGRERCSRLAQSVQRIAAVTNLVQPTRERMRQRTWISQRQSRQQDSQLPAGDDVQAVELWSPPRHGRARPRPAQPHFDRHRHQARRRSSTGPVGGKESGQ